MRNDKIKINITYNLALKHKGTLKIICNIESHTNNRTRRKIKKKKIQVGKTEKDVQHMNEQCYTRHHNI